VTDGPTTEPKAPTATAEADGGTQSGRIVVDGRPIPFEPGDSVAIAMLRAGETPGSGGTLCLAGDCGNCLVQAEGVAYVRSCQAASSPGLVVRRHPPVEMPPLPLVAEANLTAPPVFGEVSVRRVEADLVVMVVAAAGSPPGRKPRPPGGKSSFSMPERATRSSRSTPVRWSSSGR
jgi:hypothetical protein